MFHAHVLQHHACEVPGVIADWIEERGGRLTTSHVDRGDSLPTSAGDLLIVMGGPMNIYQDRDHPWLKAERAFIARHLEGGGRAIGICLGSQFLADALGGRVTQNPLVEIGWWPVSFTAEARALAPAVPESVETLHWHGDTFSLPPGAVRLASSAACENQGFVFADRVLALQFHPEVRPAMVAGLVADFGHELAPATFVQSAEHIATDLEARCARANAVLRTLLDAVFPG